MRSKRTKGFTLVEIIVSIAIASIVLMLIGTIILTSSGLLTKSGQSDLEKRIGDSVIDLVRSEIQYSSDVRFVPSNSKYAPTDEEKKNNDWHWLYVKNGRLYRDDKLVYNDNFFSSNILEISCQGNYENSQRLDIKYSLSIGNETNYSSRDTVILLNFSASDEVKKQGLYTSEYKSISQDSQKDGYVIYYNKKYNSPIGGDSSTSTGTVADELKCKDDSNSSDFLDGRKYQKNDFVLFNGLWYRAIRDVGNSVSNPSVNSKGYWKLIEPYWSNKSSYLKGDVVVYEKDSNNYYRCKKSYDGPDAKYIPSANATYWEKLSTAQVEQIKKEHNSASFCKSQLCSTSNFKTVADELCEMNAIVSKPILSNGTEQSSSNNKGDWEVNSNFSDAILRLYYKGDFVKVGNDIWRCVITYTDLTQKPGSDKTSWKKIELNYNENSVYEKDDVVKYGENYYRSKLEFPNSYPISLPLYENSPWEQVEENGNSGGWIKV